MRFPVLLAKMHRTPDLESVYVPRLFTVACVSAFYFLFRASVSSDGVYVTVFIIGWLNLRWTSDVMALEVR